MESVLMGENKIYYKTLRSSDTGLKLAEIGKRKKEVSILAWEVCKEVGAYRYRYANFVFAGGISSILFPEGTIPDKRIWKEVRYGEYMPKLSSKEGKIIAKKIESLPTVSVYDLNKCIGDEEHLFHQIGCAFTNKDFLGFIVHDDWECSIPLDCTEITYGEYNSLFLKEL